MPSKLCPTCSSWLCAEDDAFCSQCANPCADLELVALPSVLQIGDLPPRIPLKLKNTTCATLTVSGLQGPDWVSFNGDLTGAIGPQETRMIRFDAKTRGMLTPVSGEVAVDTSGGRVSLLLMAIEKQPAVLVTPSEIQIWFEKPTERKKLTFWVAPRAGHLLIRSVRPATQSGALRILTAFAGPSLASAAEPLRVTAEIDRKGAQDKAQARVLVDYEDAHGVSTIGVPLTFSVRNPPELRWTGEHQPPPELFQTSGQKLRFQFTNQAPDGSDGGRRNGLLQIDHVALRPPLEFPNISCRLMSVLPAAVAGGDSYTAEFEANLETLPARDQPYHFTLEVSTARPSLRRPAPIVVREVGLFDGIIAIDFGTSNTCCAVLETGRQPQTLTLDDQSFIAPTVIRYLDLSSSVPVIQTGAIVKNLAARSERVAASTIDGLKQQLGEAVRPLKVRPENSDEWTTRTATDAASDYLRHIRKTAEDQKHAIFQKFILTHPAVCSLLQYRNLRDALVRAFGAGAKSISFLQEPIAALVPFFSDMAQKPLQPSYSVAAFDLGGGTTDITVVQVEHSWQSPSQVDIRPQIVVSWGERLGGEDLTDFLVATLSDRCQRIIEQAHPDTQLIDSRTKGVPTADVLRNRAALREAAENFKASLSEEGKVQEPDTLIVRVIAQNAERASDFPIDFKQVRRAGGSDLGNEFLKHVQPMIERLALRLKSSTHNLKSLDYIQLSGKTTFLPVVRQVLQQVFPKSNIVRALDPKECVVRGACLSRIRGSMRRLILTDSQRTTSSLGLLDSDSSSFHTIIPFDVQIPADGLKAEMPNVWNGENSIVVWESLTSETKDVMISDTNRNLTKLGTWEPERTLRDTPERNWSLRLTLVDFELYVSAIGPGGEIIPFRPFAGGKAWARGASR